VAGWPPGDARQTGLAYAFLTPAILAIVLSGVLPMAFVFYYSVHDTFAGNSFVWVGAQWFEKVLTSPEFFGALGRSLGFSLLALAVEIPVGVFIALRLPRGGGLAAALIVLMTIPLLTPTIVVGYLWKVLTLPHAGLIYEAARALGFTYNMNNPMVAWFTLVLMDAWHWTSLVVLLCVAGLRAIPEDYYRAARVDGASAWAVFRHIQLPKLRLVLVVAVFLRFLYSFNIFTEAYVITRGGPGVSTTFLSHQLVQTATVQFDLGEGAAMALIYFAIMLVVCAAFFLAVVPRREIVAREQVS
jgi:glycerol transport system permease protein